MKGLIRFTYAKIIDSSATKAWDRVVLEETYQEFFMQAQYFNQTTSWLTFQELLDNVPGADRLHYLTSRAAMGYLQQLNQRIPDLVTVLGKRCVPFTQFNFEILASHVQHKEAHKVAIYFYSDPLTWIDTVGDQLLISHGDQREALQMGSEVTTDLIPMQPNLSISSFQPGPSSR
jgi:hypothetical protein